MEYRIIVHGLADAQAALAAAAETGVPVKLVSAPRAAAYLGAAVFREIVAAAAREEPDVPAIAVLDCGDDAGQALNALRQGLKCIRTEARGDVRRRIADIAARYGAELDDSEEAALDLAEVPDSLAACRKWLSCHPAKGRK